MALTTVKSIEKALNSIETKKNNLKKALENLQSHSSSIPKFTVTWPELDSYFTSLQSQLQIEFSNLQKKALESPPIEKPKPEKQKDTFFAKFVPARPELRTLCENMNGLRLRKYLLDRPKERTALRVELVDAYRHAPDAASMVLDALESFMSRGVGPASKMKTVCVVMLEELIRAEVEIGAEVRERARAIAVEWEGRMSATESSGGDGDGEDEGRDDEGGVEKLGYLHLLANYKLFDESWVNVDKLIDNVVAVARYRQAVSLCRVLGLESRVPDIIRRIIVKGKQLVALKFIFEFVLTDEFPPVPLLKAYLSDSKKIAQKVRTSSNSRQAQNEAESREISALKAVIKCIKDHDLESQYSKDELVARIDKLEKERAARKRPAAAPAPRPQQQPLKPPPNQNGKKRNLTASGPSKIKRKLPAKSVVPQSQSSSAYRAGSHADHPAPSPAGLYGAAGVPYMGSSADLYGHPAHLGYSSNANSVASNPYSSETYAQPSHYDGPVGYGGYSMPPQYHPGYYPQ